MRESVSLDDMVWSFVVVLGVDVIADHQELNIFLLVIICVSYTQSLLCTFLLDLICSSYSKV